MTDTRGALSNLFITDPDAAIAPLPVRRIGMPEIREALRRGVEDFTAKPSHLVFLCLIYPIAGLLLARAAVGYEVLPVIFPLVAGFALVGPFAAVGLYEISRRRERGEDTGWQHALDVRSSPAVGSIAVMGLVLMALFLGWLVAAMIIYNITFGGEVPTSLGDFLTEILTTARGWSLIVLGHIVGFAFAVVVLAISAVSFPLMLDRKVGAICAMRTSIRVVRENPVTMAAWGLFVAIALILGSLPCLVGLAIVMPVLGHATWHLYRAAVAA